MRSTISEALRGIRRLQDTDAGRLRGISLRYHHPNDRRLPARLPDELAAHITARTVGSITADTPEYIVLSDGVPVAWLTAFGHAATPADTVLTRSQARHQRLALEALTDLERWVLRELADRRAALAGITSNAHAEHDPPGTPGLRVAPGHDPTNTIWVTIGADLDYATNQLTRAVRSLGNGPPLIVSARGYGRYGTGRHRLALDVLCAMHAIADRHHLSVYAVGNWLDAEGATDAQTNVDAAALGEVFAAAYLGRFTDRRAYTTHYMSEQSWTKGLHELGIPDRYLNIRQIEHELFTRDVHDVRANPDGRHIGVFQRAPRLS